MSNIKTGGSGDLPRIIGGHQPKDKVTITRGERAFHGHSINWMRLSESNKFIDNVIEYARSCWSSEYREKIRNEFFEHMKADIANPRLTANETEVDRVLNEVSIYGDDREAEDFGNSLQDIQKIQKRMQSIMNIDEGDMPKAKKMELILLAAGDDIALSQLPEAKAAIQFFNAERKSAMSIIGEGMATILSQRGTLNTPDNNRILREVDDKFNETPIKSMKELDELKANYLKETIDSFGSLIPEGDKESTAIFKKTVEDLVEDSKLNFSKEQKSEIKETLIESSVELKNAEIEKAKNALKEMVLATWEGKEGKSLSSDLDNALEGFKNSPSDYAKVFDLMVKGCKGNPESLKKVEQNAIILLSEESTISMSQTEKMELVWLIRGNRLKMNTMAAIDNMAIATSGKKNEIKSALEEIKEQTGKPELLFSTESGKIAEFEGIGNRAALEKDIMSREDLEKFQEAYLTEVIDAMVEGCGGNKQNLAKVERNVRELLSKEKGIVISEKRKEALIGLVIEQKIKPRFQTTQEAKNYFKKSFASFAFIGIKTDRELYNLLNNNPKNYINLKNRISEISKDLNNEITSIEELKDKRIEYSKLTMRAMIAAMPTNSNDDDNLLLLFNFMNHLEIKSKDSPIPLSQAEREELERILDEEYKKHEFMGELVKAELLNEEQMREFMNNPEILKITDLEEFKSELYRQYPGTKPE